MRPLIKNVTETITRFLRPERSVPDAADGVLTRDERFFFAVRDRHAIGVWGEDLAAKFLSSCGLRILERNVRERFSELDIVARQGNELVFVEVRCRARSKVMTAAETMGPRKWRRLARGAEMYVFKSDWSGPWRIDLISVDVTYDRWHLSWLKYLEMEE